MNLFRCRRDLPTLPLNRIPSNNVIQLPDESGENPGLLKDCFPELFKIQMRPLSVFLTRFPRGAIVLANQCTSKPSSYPDLTRDISSLDPDQDCHRLEPTHQAS